MIDQIKPFFWLYEKYPDAKIICDTCERFEECGRVGYICGSWEPAGQYQITMEVPC